MSSTYVLLVQSAEGILWKPGPLQRKTPNLYVAIYQDNRDVAVHRTRAKRSLTPEWRDCSTISADSDASAICLRLWHDSALPGGNLCLGAANITIAELRQMCPRDEDQKFAKLQPRDADDASSGKQVGTLLVCLMTEAVAAAPALEQAEADVQKIQHGPISAAIMKAAGQVMNSSTTLDRFQSALSNITTKLEVIVGLGDEIAKIHPYANVAWKVLTSVYQAAKQQQEADDKLLKLVDTMKDAYSFVEEAQFLAQKIKSLEDKSLAIVQHTVKCALFIQDYTLRGFGNRVVGTAFTQYNERIDELSSVFVNLKASFEGRLTLQSLFLSTKMLRKIDGVDYPDRSDTLKQLKLVEMNAASRSSCLPGTRSDILDAINEWLSIPSKSGNVLWLSGVAGSGKSTLSTTIAEHFRSLHLLGAFLFFDRNDGERSHPDKVIQTLAYLLAQSNPCIGAAISTVIQDHPDIVNAMIQTQFKTLLFDPLNSVEDSIQGPIVIILDALDECGDATSRALLLSVLSAELLKLPPVFRFLITSREEKDISYHFQSFAQKQLDITSATPDIALFIDHEINVIREHEDLGSA
ncbi:hypothetical protein K438DRAFT_1947590 [Mycena galopus ATCC 62051]|nr:hypothetical protein K438DRAFT_1947590 [Mycena galopus ATCC 62051]